MQTPIDALQEQCNTTSATNSHVVLQLEHAQSLLLQFSEGFAEVSPWLEETQTLIGQLSLSTISYEAFREQQDLLQVGETCLHITVPAFFFSFLIIPFLSRSTKKSLYTLQSATIFLWVNELFCSSTVHYCTNVLPGRVTFLPV